MNRVVDYLTSLLVRPFRPNRRASLKAINRARVAIGLDPVDALPSGEPGDFRSCPLSLLLPGIVGVNGISFENQADALRVASAWNTAIEIGGRGRMVVLLPSLLRRFVRDFDLGAYPSLIRKREQRTWSARRSPDRGAIKHPHTFRPSDDRRAA